MSSIYYLEKLTFSKLVKKVNFSERKLEEQWQGISGETFILALLASAVFRLPNSASDFL